MTYRPRPEAPRRSRQAPAGRPSGPPERRDAISAAERLDQWTQQALRLPGDRLRDPLDRLDDLDDLDEEEE
ncbi:hypothetical protein JS756_05345 [Streptomyces actuosus]|uniref:Uncharacterized protein n=1 Tax=Streptomyces actuosus TaxID=1885 RepID=A0ABS2VKG1_STRAS|nr:hypothetical protein [Streptomyces actuosus]MBN0043536.1 hypothetical protein [Streptomyces actuosus]